MSMCSCCYSIVKSSDMDGEMREPWVANEGFMGRGQRVTGKAGIWWEIACGKSQTWDDCGVWRDSVEMGDCPAGAQHAHWQQWSGAGWQE